MKKATTKTKTNEINITIEEPKKRFIIIYESVYKNNNLSVEELGFLVKLIASAPTFKKTKENFKKVLNISEREYFKITKGLKEKGYLKINKYGNKSEWIITQEPKKDILKDFKNETIINAILKYKITLEDLDIFHSLKYIDDNQYIKINNEVLKERIKIAKNKEYLEND